MNERILITGASGGFGRLITLQLLGAGHSVVASMRDPRGRSREVAAELEAAGAHLVTIDVTDDAGVEEGVRAALDHLGGLDVLINNAGVGASGLHEQFTPADWERLFAINVFGVQRMNRAVLPHFHARGGGLLLHVSSLLGRITIPYYGPYNASKWALEALAENYRTELSGLGIETCLVEPGGFPTTFHDNLIRPGDNSREGFYGDAAQAPATSLAHFGEFLANNPQQDPKLVAEAITNIIAMPAGQRPFRTVVDEIGMAAPVQAYNEKLDEITRGIYGAMGMEDMLQVRLRNWGQ